MECDSSLKRLAFALVAFALWTPAKGSIILNGDFESVANSPGFAGSLTTPVNLNSLADLQWGVFQFIPGWEVVSGMGIEVQRNTIVKAASGTNYVEMDTDVTTFGQGLNSKMKQSVSLTQGTYHLSFWYLPRLNTVNTNGLLVEIAGLASISADGVNSDFADWIKYSNTFQVSTSGDYDLTVEALGIRDGLGGFLDNISLAKVPEPSALLLASATLLAFGFGRRLVSKKR